MGCICKNVPNPWYDNVNVDGGKDDETKRAFQNEESCIDHPTNNDEKKDVQESAVTQNNLHVVAVQKEDGKMDKSTSTKGRKKKKKKSI